MAEVKVGENESIESALRRFKKKIQKAGILSEVKNVKDMKSQALRENANQKQLVNAKYNNLKTVCRKTDRLF